jgi:hypothetical protein
MSEKERIESARSVRKTARFARQGGAALFLAGALAYAPYQCGKSPEPSLREETPGEALYDLALKMKADGDEQGYRSTLRYIVARYPSSRQAAAARLELAADGGDTDAL